MHLSIPLITLLTSLSIASPTTLTPRTKELTTPNPATTAEIAKAIEFAVIAASCDVLKCVSVVAAAPCVIGAIGKGPLGVAELIGCVSDGRDAVSICVGLVMITCL